MAVNQSCYPPWVFYEFSICYLITVYETLPTTYVHLELVPELVFGIVKLWKYNEWSLTQSLFIPTWSHHCGLKEMGISNSTYHIDLLYMYYHEHGLLKWIDLHRSWTVHILKRLMVLLGSFEQDIFDWCFLSRFLFLLVTYTIHTAFPGSRNTYMYVVIHLKSVCLHGRVVRSLSCIPLYITYHHWW